MSRPGRPMWSITLFFYILRRVRTQYINVSRCIQLHYRLFSVVVLSITADNEISHLYIDGCEFTNLKNGKVWEKADSVTLSLTANVIAVQILNVGDVGGLLASTDTISLRTDVTWKVTTNYTSGWMNVNFDDTSWKNATAYGNNGDQPWKNVSAITENAQWISTANILDKSVFFRYHLKRRHF